MNQINCPDCRCALVKSKTRCACGWMQESNTSAPKASQFLCAYEVSGNKCPLPGVSSSSIRGLTKWYCSRHKETLNDPIKAELALKEIIQNYQQIIASRRDWRDMLHINQGHIK